MSDRKPRPPRPYRGPTAKPYGPPRRMTRDELNARMADAWKVLPPVKLAMNVAADGAITPKYRCPDDRCGVDGTEWAVCHPGDESKTANRCPTCLSTVVPYV